MKTALLAATLAISSASFAASAPKPDSDMKMVLDTLARKNPKPIEKLSAEEARRQPTVADATMDVIRKDKGSFVPMPVDSVVDREINGADGKIMARIYTPKEVKMGEALPVIVYFHGGGFVIATNDTYDATPRALANGAKAIVVSPEYRKAPENKFPAAHNDAFAAYKWVLANATSFNGNPMKVAVAGESAGGNLALNVAIMARDQKITMPTHELLIYPVVGTDMNTESYIMNKDAKPLNKAMMGWFVKNYTRSPDDLKDSRINLLSANFKGLNPATVITAEIDPLMTEGEKLSKEMQKQGVTVDYKNYEGVTHEFFGMAPVVMESQAAQMKASDNIRNSFQM